MFVINLVFILVMRSSQLRLFTLVVSARADNRLTKLSKPCPRAGLTQINAPSPRFQHRTLRMRAKKLSAPRFKLPGAEGREVEIPQLEHC